MAEIVCGVAASHTTLMNTRWDAVDHLPEAHAFRDSLGDARDVVAASGADVALVIGPNHFRGFWLDLMPSFTVGVGDVIGAGEHGTPSGSLPTDNDLARSLHQGMFDAGFDPAFSLKLTVDHGLTHAVQYVIPDGMPMVPLVVNCIAPPLPSLTRCAALGELVGQLIAGLGRDVKVAVIGSGGLSHRLPFPDWRDPRSDDDDFLIESWVEGRNDWAQYEDRRRSIIMAAPADINEDFDQHLLAAWSGGTMSDLTTLSDLTELAGNGGNEVRSWIMAAAACGWSAGRTLCYSPVEPWLTGMATGVIESPISSPVAPASFGGS